MERNLCIKLQYQTLPGVPGDSAREKKWRSLEGLEDEGRSSCLHPRGGAKEVEWGGVLPRERRGRSLIGQFSSEENEREREDGGVLWRTKL